jgi:AraC family transcriptional regulator
VDHSAWESSVPEASFDVPPEHIVQSSRGKDWDGVDIAEVVHPLDDFVLPAIPRHVLVVNLGSPAEAQERLGGRQGHLGTGSLTILPAGAPSKWHLDRQGEVRHLHLYLPSALVYKIAAEAGINPDTVELIDAIGVHDPQIETIALSFLAELRAGGVGGKIYTESLTNLLVVHLLRHHSSVKQSPLPRPRGLARTTLKLVVSYIEDHLAEGLSLSEIAAVASLSPYHFAHLFKHSTGLSPHQYIIHRRVERAKLLLSTTNWPIIFIAHSVGFASESHLAMHFKRLTGVTPKHYR